MLKGVAPWSIRVERLYPKTTTFILHNVYSYSEYRPFKQGFYIPGTAMRAVIAVTKTRPERVFVEFLEALNDGDRNEEVAPHISDHAFNPVLRRRS